MSDSTPIAAKLMLGVLMNGTGADRLVVVAGDSDVGRTLQYWREKVLASTAEYVELTERVYRAQLSFCYCACGCVEVYHYPQKTTFAPLTESAAECAWCHLREVGLIQDSEEV